MSAYMVEPETIQRIMEGMNYFRKDISHVPYRMPEPEEVRAYMADQTPENIKALGQAMVTLNALSVGERYGKDQIMAFGVSLVFLPKPVDFPSRVEFFKSLRCYLHQSCEGNADQTALYKYLDKVSDEMAHTIVNDLPEYNKAQWA